MKRILSPVSLAIVVAAAAVPQAAMADSLPFQASFAVAASATPNTQHAMYCGGTALDLNVEAHGDGYSSLGPLSLFLQKTIASPSGPMHGCLTLNTPDGDSLLATYDGTEEAANANNFVTTASGTLTFTGGTGRFTGVKGKATFTAVFDLLYPGSSFAGGKDSVPVRVMAYYLVEGKVSVGGEQ